MKITVSSPKLKARVEIDINIPKDLDSLIELYGSDNIAALAAKAIKDRASCSARQYLARGVKPERVAELMRNWHPVQRMKRMQDIAIEDMDPNILNELLKEGL